MPPVPLLPPLPGAAPPSALEQAGNTRRATNALLNMLGMVGIFTWSSRSAVRQRAISVGGETNHFGNKSLIAACPMSAMYA